MTTAHAQALPQPGPSTPQSDDSPSPPSLGGAPSPRVGLHRGGVLVLRRELPEGLQLILGRTPECDLRLSHPTVSRTHARLWNDGGEVYVEDLGTVHGTWLHGERIEGRRRLVDGDTLHLGQSGAEGHVLRLEDPAMGLLRELGLLGARGKGSAASVSEDDGVETVADPAPESAPGAESEGAPSSDRPADGEDPEPVPTPGVAAALVRNPFAWAGAVLALSLVSAMAWGLYAATPTAVGWRWVHLSPPEVAGGVNLALDSPDIRGGSQVELTLGGFDLPAQIVPGRVSTDIPVLEGDDLDIGGRFARPGRYDLPLVARTAGVEVFRATLGYVVTPRIDAVEPPSAEVGEEVTILGRRFGGEGEVEVRVGNAPAEVLEASDQRLRVRVPAVGGGRTARRHLSVAVGPWRARSAAPLEIRAQPPEAAPPLFTAAKDRGRWRVRPRVGPAMVYGSRAAAREGARAWNRLFDLALDDPSLELVTTSEHGRHGLVAQGRSLGAPLVLGRWGAADLRATTETGELSVQPGVLLHWVATVWRPLLDALGRGVVPEVEASVGLEPSFQRALEAVVAARAGGTESRAGGPHRWVAKALGVAEHRELAASLRRFPRHLAEVSGRWSGRLENVFFPGEGYRCRLDLDLQRVEETLGGTARLTFINETSGIELGLPEVPVQGELVAGLEPQVLLTASFAKPVGDLTFDATFGGGRLLGFYRGPRVPAGSARWKAERWVAPATDW